LPSSNVIQSAKAVSLVDLKRGLGVVTGNVRADMAAVARRKWNAPVRVGAGNGADTEIISDVSAHDLVVMRPDSALKKGDPLSIGR
jgi:hypothetical protein